MTQLVVLALALLSQASEPTDVPLKDELQNDVVLRAMVDELERNMKELVLPGLERPYFIEFAIKDTSAARVSAKLGATLYKNAARYRQLRTDVRVGSYELDNTNFSGDQSGSDFGGMSSFGGAPLPIEDDYGAIRQSIWWTADRDYKGVVEQLEKKKAFMENKVVEGKPSDFSRAKPTVYFEPRLHGEVDLNRLEKVAIDLSRVLLTYPQVKDSGVEISKADSNDYLTNSEGTRMRVASRECALTVEASVQAGDGMELADELSINVESVADLPPLDELTAKCKQMIDRLIAVKDAPLLDSYAGPVLFDPEAAAAVFSDNFADRFTGGQRPVGTSADPDDFAHKLGKRVLPKFVDVFDDPTLVSVAGKLAMGHYKYDAQGVEAQRVNLVEHGRLKGLLMSRNPSKEFSASNGHGRADYGAPQAAVGCLVVSTDSPSSESQLKEELFEACEDEDLDFGIRIKSLGDVGGDSSSSFSFGSFGDDDGQPGVTPLAMYKIYPDGREELVRGAEIAEIDLKAFKRILAVGDKPYVLNESDQTVAVPALLFEELDLSKIERDFDTPPILPNPLARAVARATAPGD